MKEERFPHLGKSPHRQGDEPGRRGSFRASEESAATRLRKAKRRVTCRGGRHRHPALPSLRLSSFGAGGGWVKLKLRLQRSDPGRGPGMAAWRQPEEAGVWPLRGYLEEAWACQRGKAPLWGGGMRRGVGPPKELLSL